MTAPPSLVFLDHAGGCARLLREADSPSTAGIGAPTDWPAALQLLTGLMLGASEAMFVAWGPQRLLFYNDAYVPILGVHHPAALGQPMQQVWQEVWPEIGPLVDRVFTGHSVQMDDIALTLQRGGQPVEAHFSFGYHPVRDDQGTLSGLFCVCRETTVQRREQAERDEATARLVQSEAARQISEERFQAAVRAVGLMWTQNAQGEMDGEQFGWAALTGQTPAQYRGDGWSSAIHPDDLQPTLIA